MKDLVYWEKSQVRDALLQHMDGAAVILNSHVRIQKATYAVLKLAHLCRAILGNF
jgi:hypothetical protein